MAQKLLLVNEWDVRQRFELTPEEASQLLDVHAAFICLSDSLYLETQGSDPVGVPCIVLHPGITHLTSTKDQFAQYVEVLKEYRGEKQADVNPLTGKHDDIVRIGPPKKPDLN